ncbi:CATRA system-associated protein [Amycolatopsis aidingensis]|uniref:CATRA system-associated protein n=1 Tax=Amycolatopsis aidingensis TaxID=2842453 RepID=UPI001C0BB069|nr:CATRA system-associated protein [Amycolatopsis aidingensis]
MTGTIVTFYSYKGGVGRSFALANVAVLLARWGYRVLTIDWDLEAPGLHHYFAPMLPKAPDGGVVDLAYDFLAGAKRPADHAVRLDIEDGIVALLAAGRQDEGYTRRVQDIDWDDLYQRGFASFLERCRREWAASYDFVLIDSRTGLSDIGGICTAQLPDRLVVVFTANQQSVEGVVDAARLADRARDRLPYDRAVHMVLPILARLDNRVEYERAESWQRRCAETVAPLFHNWVSRGVPTDVMLRHLTLPYVSYWSFGEQLPVLEERSPSADQISFALETVAAVIAQQFDRTDLLADNRDAYVASARTQEREYELDLLVSTPRSVLDMATQFIDELGALGVRAHRSLSGHPDFLDRNPDPARHLCLIVDKEVSRWQATEAERFLRHALDADGDRRLFCVLTRNTDRERLPWFLRNLRHLEFDTVVRPRQVAQQLYELLNRTSPSRADSARTALREAAAALRNVPEEVAHRGRWTLIEQTVREMTAALDADDLALFQDLTVDLEQLNEVRANSDRFTAPDGLGTRIGELIERLDRRINVSHK